MTGSLLTFRGADQTSKFIKDNGNLVFSLLEKGVTNIKREKSRMNSVVLELAITVSGNT